MIDKPERIVFLFISILLTFLILNFDPNMGQVFLLFGLSAGMLYLYDKVMTGRIDFPIERYPEKRLEAVIWAIGAFVILIIITSALKLAGITGFEAVIVFFAQYVPFFAQYSPALSGNPWLIFLGWGLLIPVTETIFFSRAFEGFLDIFNVRPDIRNAKVWAAILLTSALFSLFHLSAKGVVNNPALIMTFIFGMITWFIVVVRKQLLEGLLFHVIANSVAIIATLNLLSVSPFFLAVGIGVGLYIILMNISPRRVLV